MYDPTVMDRVKNAADTKLWIPGAGDVPLDVLAVQNAIREHDDQLYLARHELTGDWCIFIQGLSGRTPLPVIGLGRHLPSVDEVKQRLYRADTRIHGSRILSDMHKRNEAAEAEKHAKVDEAQEAAAEAYMWAHTDIKGYSGRTANIKGHRRDQAPRYQPKAGND